MINNNMMSKLKGAIMIGIIIGFIGFSYFLLDELQRTLHALNQTEVAQQIGRIKSTLVLFLDSLLSLPKDTIKIIVTLIIIILILVIVIYKKFFQEDWNG
ncbi:MAG: hypothetical protein QW714_01280 [Nanopusillaceae archaeon]